MSVANELAELEEVVPNRRTKDRAVHPYFGKVDSALAREIILRFSEPGGVVLDPFCGSGTVLAEAIATGRSVAGRDSSPLACMITAARLIPVAPAHIAEVKRFAGSLLPYSSDAGLHRQLIPDADAVPPHMPRVLSVASWFGDNALRELSFLRTRIDAYTFSPQAELVARVAFSRIVVPASRQQGESTYKRVEKPDHPGRVVDMFVKATIKVLAAMTETSETHLLAGSSAPSIDFRAGNYRASGALDARIECSDSRSPWPKLDAPADLVVTSPPYLMSWDYGLYHKFRFYFCGFDLDGYEEAEIGRHLRRRNDDVERYTEDMRSVFGHLRGVVRLGGRAAFVNAPSIAYGVEVDTDAILVSVARGVGWRLVDQARTIGIPGPHHGMHMSADARGAHVVGERGKREHVLLFEAE